MIPFKAIYKEQEISLLVPQSHSELTLHQLSHLEKWDKKDFIALLAILCNVDYDVLFNSSSLDIEEKIIPLLAWLQKPADYKTIPLPKNITIDGKQYDVPEDIGVKTLGQKLSLQLYLAQAHKDGRTETECLAFALAVYFQPEVTGTTYNEEEAKKLIPVMRQCKMIEAYPVGTFFLRRFIKSLSEKQGNSAAPEATKNIKPGLKNWMRLAHLGLLTRSQKEIFYNMTKS